MYVKMAQAFTAGIVKITVKNIWALRLWLNVKSSSRWSHCYAATSGENKYLVWNFTFHYHTNIHHTDLDAKFVSPEDSFEMNIEII